MAQIIHYPRLDTVLMVEKTLQEAELVMSKNELSRRLPKQVMRQTLNVILNYLEEKGMIMTGKKGILWIYNDSPKMKKLIEESVDAEELFSKIQPRILKTVLSTKRNKQNR